jgi:hypothetical protein
MLSIALFVFIVLVMLFAKKLVPTTDRLFFYVFSIATLYFGVLGPWYWLAVDDGYFININWSDEIWIAQLAYFCSFIFVALLLVFGKKRNYIPLVPEFKLPASQFEYLFLGAGSACAAYVMLNAKSFALRGIAGMADPLLLMMYQASDMLIPVILFRICRKGFGAENIALIIGFVTYAIFLGYRYKLILFLFPVGMIYFSSGKRFSPARIALVIVGGFLVLGLFTIMTNARAKFGGLALSGSGASDDLLGSGAMLYGFFAESNILFGLCSILKNYTNYSDWVFFTPIISSFLDFIPRALYPDKHLYGYVANMYIGLGGAETSTTGTAYPYFGEYLMSAGWAGMMVGLILYVIGYRFMLVRLLRFAPTKKIMSGGIALLSIFWGYYYFSRGFSPQILKGVVFVLVPYWILMKSRRNGSDERAARSALIEVYSARNDR